MLTIDVRQRLGAAFAHLRVPAGSVTQCDAVLRARVRGSAPVLAALTLGWTALDWAVLSPREAALTTGIRVLMAATLLALPRLRRVSAATLVHAFVGVQAVGFSLLQLVPMHSASSMRIGYDLFPFVVAAQLALFPVSWWQTLRAALAPAAMLAIAVAAAGRHLDAATWSDIWLLALLVLVAAWTTQAQLDLLLRLLGARREASHDALTGLANRRLADARLDAEYARCLRHGEALSVLMADLDFFKRVNDHYGHAVGDLVLIATAEAIAAELRASDLGARYGGEEFLVVLPESASPDAMHVAERIRARVAGLRVRSGDTVVAPTISVGVATLSDGDSVASLVARADAALYRAKDAGRNRIATIPAISAHP